MIISVSNIFDGDDTVLDESYQNGTATKLLEAFEAQLSRVEVAETGLYSNGSRNIAVMVGLLK